MKIMFCGQTFEFSFGEESIYFQRKKGEQRKENFAVYTHYLLNAQENVSAESVQ
jgi:hypothetical protein